MNKYEMTVVISAKLEEEGRTAELDKVKAFVEKFGGTIANIDNVNAPSEIESQLRIMENVLRFMTVAVEA